MQTGTTSKGFGGTKPIGKFANTNTAELTATRAQAIAEIEREANVRMKCFDRWITDGRMTDAEATERMGGIVAAWHFLNDTDQARRALLAETQA